MHSLTDLLVRFPPPSGDEERIARKMIDLAYRDGIRTICYVSRLPSSAMAKDVELRADLVAYANRQYPDLRLIPGAELVCSSEVDARAISSDPPTIGSSDVLLVSLEKSLSPESLFRTLMLLRETGHGILLSNADTLESFLKYPSLALRMVELGILFQVSARSILGENQLKRKGFCKAMLKNGAIFAIVSDSCEHLRHPPRLSRCYTYLKRHYDEQLASRLLFFQPNALLGHSTNR